MPDQLLFPQVLRDDLQNKLFHHLSRDGDEADWMQFLALSEDWSDITQAPPVFSKALQKHRVAQQQP